MKSSFLTKNLIFTIAIIILSILTCQESMSQQNSEDAIERLREVKKAINKGKEREKILNKTTKELSADIKALRKTLVEAAHFAHLQEENVSKLEKKLNNFHKQEKIKENQLSKQWSSINFTLRTLQNISRRPSEVFFENPDKIKRNIQSTILLASLIPQLEKQSLEIRSELLALKNIRKNINNQKVNIDNAKNLLQREKIALDRLINRKSNLRGRAFEEAIENRKQIEKLAKNALNLQSLINSIKSVKTLNYNTAEGDKNSKLGLRFSSSRGKLPMPARGIVSVQFGQKNDVGLKSKGLVIQTRQSARVISPHNGKIVFAGPFRRYGKLLIISHGEGYHTLLTGFKSINVTVGQKLIAGEPIGIMGFNNNGKKPELYIELRHNGEPIDPKFWITLTKRG
ncbi:peptidoglycan DD-metalloendopeptidase family protein [Alphaproteobacteria bacterium]|nr:peptidoglycan DD-metalloendopeptidase family protein [Alphaproteobacteria bacterium]